MRIPVQGQSMLRQWVRKQLMDCKDTHRGYEFLKIRLFSTETHKSMMTYWPDQLCKVLKHLMTGNEQASGGLQSTAVLRLYLHLRKGIG